MRIVIVDALDGWVRRSGLPSEVLICFNVDGKVNLWGLLES